MPSHAETLGKNWIFQNDGASIHRSNFTKMCFLNKRVDVMETPAKSPDLNFIENHWGIIARSVYSGNRPFELVGDLCEVILEEWIKIGSETIKPQCRSLLTIFIN